MKKDIRKVTKFTVKKIGEIETLVYGGVGGFMESLE